jgi:hypothetical protein
VTDGFNTANAYNGNNFFDDAGSVSFDRHPINSNNIPAFFSDGEDATYSAGQTTGQGSISPMSLKGAR